MLAALRLGSRKSDPSSIAEDIESRTGHPVVSARVYQALGRLEKKGFVSRPGNVGEHGEGCSPAKVKVELDGVAAVRATTEGILAMVGDLNLRR